MSRIIKVVPTGDLGGAAKKTVKITLTAVDGSSVAGSAPQTVTILASGH